MKKTLAFFASIALGLNLSAQSISVSQFSEPLNTGANMTLGFNTDQLDQYSGAKIGAFNGNGICVGLETIQDEFFTMALWGNDSGTSETDGLLNGETPNFAILTNNNIVIPLASINNFNGYITNFMAATTVIATAGCTNDDMLEYHTQGYLADEDDGSCLNPIFTFDISPSDFSSNLLTDNNMVIGMNTSDINIFEGATLGAFFDIDADGVLDCINTEIIQGSDNGSNGFFTISLWGDDELTPETDGLSQGDIPTFAILTTSNHVIAFQSVPDFTGYAANAFPSFSEITFDFTVYGCMDDAYCNYNPDAEEDDGSCEGLPGCTDDHYMEFDQNADCLLEGACITSWQEAHSSISQSYNALNSLNASLNDSIQNLHGNMAQQASNNASNIASLNATIQAQEASFNASIILLENEITNLSSIHAQNIDSLNNEIDQITNQYTSEIDELNSQISELTAPISIDILEGWNLIGYTLDFEQDVSATLESIVENILIVKNNNADVYWPEFGFNGIGNFIPGQGYQIKVTQDILSYQYPDVSGARIENTPTVPQWVIDMPTELHPNDIKSLVKIVNILGQEVSPELEQKGTTLIYLYSDGSVEKKLK